MSDINLSPEQHCDRRIGDMLHERSSWESHWKKLARSFSPRRSRFFSGDRNKGSDLENDIINNMPIMAKRTLKAGLMTGITSPARPWFRLAPPDPGMEDYGAVRNWLDQVERLMYRVFSSSNLYQQLPNVYDEISVIGTAAMIAEEDYENIVKFSTFTVGEYALDINGRLEVDSFCREYEMTVYQVIDKFGIENVSQNTKRLFEQSAYSAPVTIRHLIEPVAIKKFDDPKYKLDKRFAYRSIYYEKGTTTNSSKLLRIKGYKEFPIMAPRWDAKTGDTYGFSAAMDALGDARALQVKEREKGKAIAKMVSPPTKAPSSLESANISLLPGANTFVDDPNDVFSPIYQVNMDVTQLSYDIGLNEDRINKAFFVDLFLMISSNDKVRTATEIASREEEKLLMLGPVLESLHNELLDPLIDRTFSIIIREAERGWKGLTPMLLPPPPPELADSELKVDYISVLAQAQKMIATTSMERWVGFAGQVSQFKPEVMDIVDCDEIVTQMGESLGVSSKLIRNEEEVSKIRQSRNKQQEMIQNQQAMSNMLGAASELSNMDTTGGNALSDLVGAVGG